MSKICKKKNKKDSKKSYRRLLSNILLLLAIFLLNYPLVSDILNGSKTNEMYSEYVTTVTESFDEYEEEDLVRKYNKKLLAEENRFIIEKENSDYHSLLCVQGTIMGYVDIPTAGVVSLPIYHSTSTESLQNGAGHMAGSSLPSDEEKGVHTIISAHTGMSGMKGFSGLTRVKKGDTFTISYLNKILTYKVTAINVVLPEETDLLAIDSEKNLCSLVTCTPLGVNSHRLIVTGELHSEEKIATGTKTQKISLNFSSIADRFAWYEFLMTGISIILLIIFIKDIIKTKKEKKKKRKVTTITIPIIYLKENE